MFTYDRLYALDGADCWTVARHNPMTIHVDDSGVTVVVPSGKERLISREDVEDVMQHLAKHHTINGTEMRDRLGIRSANTRIKLFAILAVLPDIAVTLNPRTLHFAE